MGGRGRGCGELADGREGREGAVSWLMGGRGERGCGELADGGGERVR